MSRRSIPETFLRNTGIPGKLIQSLRTYLAKLPADPACVLVYGPSDGEIAKNIFSSLVKRRLRVWGLDLTSGPNAIGEEELQHMVETRDTLIVLCSVLSLQNTRILALIEKTLDGSTAFLIPVCVDDRVFGGDHWLQRADPLLKSTIDFRQWKQKDEYRKSLAKLVRRIKTRADQN